MTPVSHEVDRRMRTVARASVRFAKTKSVRPEQPRVLVPGAMETEGGSMSHRHRRALSSVSSCVLGLLVGAGATGAYAQTAPDTDSTAEQPQTVVVTGFR